MASIDPTDKQLAAIANSDSDEPIVMLNLNKYRDKAEYLDPKLGNDLSGRDAYLRYGVVAQRALGEVGARILWATESDAVVIGEESMGYDEVVAVWYPNRAAFLDLLAIPWHFEALVHRNAAVEKAAVLVCTGDKTPTLTSPFDA